MLTPLEGLELLLGFYVEERADGCALEDDADGLLYQWGTYDWGQGESFELDLTRQLMLPGEGDDEGIWQLSLTFRYAPNDELRDLASANRWCFSPAEVEELRDFVIASPPMRSGVLQGLREVSLRFECVG